MHPGVEAQDQHDTKEMYLNNVWRASLAITGAGGLPSMDKAGNVIRGATTLRCSMRLPPSMDPKKAEAIMKEKLTKDVPHNAKITITGDHSGGGWCMKTLTKPLDGSL
jgi:acetylornithine deacetylase/succinyl-diaminopimelate desuccinylase-like protein